MNAFINFVAVGLFSISTLSFASQAYNQEPMLDYYGTGSDGDNTTGLLLKQTETMRSSASASAHPGKSHPPHTDTIATGNDAEGHNHLSISK